MGSVDKTDDVLAFLRGGPLKRRIFVMVTRHTRIKTNQSRPLASPRKRLISWLPRTAAARPGLHQLLHQRQDRRAVGPTIAKITHKHQRTAPWMVPLQVVAQMAQQREQRIELAMDITHDIQRSFGKRLNEAHGMAGGFRPMERAAQQASPSIYFEVISGGALWHAKTTFQRPCEVCNRPWPRN